VDGGGVGVVDDGRGGVVDGGEGAHAQVTQAVLLYRESSGSETKIITQFHFFRIRIYFLDAGFILHAEIWNRILSPNL
jgi:hypothetical protein